MGNDGSSRRMMGSAALVVLLVAAAGAVYLAVRGAGRAGPADARAAPATAESLDATMNAVLVLTRDGEYAKAVTVLDAAIAQYPTEHRLYVQRGEVLAAQRKPKEAYESYVQALACGPRDGETEFAAGTLASMTGQLDRAVEHYQAAQQKLTTDYRPALFLAQVLLKLEQVEDAKTNLMIAARLKPDAAIIWGTLAEVALRENKNSIAVQHVTKARELEPRVTLWRLVEARALKRSGDPEAALRGLAGLEEAERREPAVLAVIGECYGLLSRPAEAAAVYAAAADAKGEDGALALETALWYERAGNKANALRYAERAQMLAVAAAGDVVKRLRSGQP